jgi:uncharacterized protein
MAENDNEYEYEDQEVDAIQRRDEYARRQRETDVLKWREERAKRLKENEKSWFGLIGLFWLDKGENTFGSDPTNKFILPPFAPKKAGSFFCTGDQVTIKPAPDVEITCNGGPLPTQPLHNDMEEHPDFLEMGRLVFVVLLRGKSLLIRVWDRENPARLEFKGLNWYPYNPEFCVTARYTPYAPFVAVQREDIIGVTHERKLLGQASFNLKGQQVTLEAEEGEEGLFFSFSDKTSGDTTYPGGRYLISEKPEEGHVLIDFNKAYNMPCAYVVYATCGLPILANRMDIPIEAGEKKFKDEH